MGKKKKKKKSSKTKSSADTNLSVKQLTIKGDQILARGNARDALTLFKQVEKKTGRNAEIDSCLFSAYLIRQKQLCEKGLVSESEHLKRYVCEYFPGIEKISEDQMKDYLKCCSIQGAFDAYRHYFSKLGTSQTLELTLADLLLQERCWHFLSDFRQSEPLRRDSETVRKAIPKMENGQWEDAMEALRPIARISPFASLRMFCRAMAAFYKEDDTALERAATMISEDFCLKPLLDALTLTVSKTVDESFKMKAFQHLDCLYDGALNAENQARDLLFDLKHKQSYYCAGKIEMLAKSIYPEDCDVAVIEIIHILWKIFFDDFIQANIFEKLVRKVLPKNKAELLVAKFSFLISSKNLSDAGRYLAVLPTEFPDEKEKQIAHSLILLDTVSAALNKNGGYGQRMFESRACWFQYEGLLGARSDDDEMLPIELIRKSIELDPDNRTGYELLSRFSYNSRDAKNAVEDIFISMMKRFADDPYPCLELATLYYSKNAFRKAENVLQIAMERAPHDNRVLDRHALSLLISAEKNMNSGRYHLSWPDLEKARQLGRKKHSPLLAAKRAVHRNLAENEAIENAIGKETENFSTVEYLRTLGILLSDLKSGKANKNSALISELTKTFKTKVQKASKLSSEESAALLAPLDNQYDTLLPRFSMTQLVTQYNPKIFKSLNNRDFLAVIDTVLDPSLFPMIMAELKYRIKKTPGSQSLIFEFYLAVMENMSGKNIGSDPFTDIIDRASGKERKVLEDASRRLAFHARGILQTALQRFEFDMLDPVFSGPGMGPLMDVLEKLNDKGGELGSIREMLENLKDSFDPSMAGIFDLSDEEDEVWEIADDLEDMIDEAGIRDAPESIIKDFRNHMRSSPKSRRKLNELAHSLKHVADDLSREAQIFLYGKAWL